MRVQSTAAPAGDIVAPARPAESASSNPRFAEALLVAIGPQGTRSGPSAAVKAKGRAKLAWDNQAGADAFIVVRDGKEIAGPIRIEGARKKWTDEGGR